MGPRKILAVVVGLGLLVAPTAATAAPATESLQHYPAAATRYVTVTGKVGWGLSIDAVDLANGYQASCGKPNGDLTVWGGKTAKQLVHVSQRVYTVSKKKDSNGTVTWLCSMPYSVRVPRRVRYALTWANATPYPNDNCANSKSTDDDQFWTDNTNRKTYSRPLMSFAFVCTYSGLS